ncbi:MAG: SURF1 family protein [Gemmatimonadaceae bacterium]
MRPRTLLALIIPLFCAALFVRLGLWQLNRHRDRAVINAALATRLAAEPIPLGALASDTLDRRWTRITVSGRFRYDLEQILAGRTSEGSPGVHLLTPLSVPGTDALIVVTRGWVYSPDAASADLGRWREAEEVSLAGYLLPLASARADAPVDTSGALRVATRAALEARLGQPVAPVQIVMTSDSLARVDSVPRRLPPPTIDVGPHRSYAIQWFAFAVIAAVGGVILFRSSGKSQRGIVADRAGG